VKKAPEKPRVKKSFPLLRLDLMSPAKPLTDLKSFRELRADPERYAQFVELRKRFLALAGVENLSDMDNQEGNKQLAEIIRRNIANMFEESLVPDYVINEEVRRLFALDKLEDLSMEADGLINYAAERFFPGAGGKTHIGMINEIENCDDVGRLPLIWRSPDGNPDNPRDPGWGNRARWEAQRKLALIELFAYIRKYLKERREHKKGLAYFDRLMNEHIYSFNGGRKKGDFQVKYLVSEHGFGEINDCVATKLFEDRSEAEVALEGEDFVCPEAMGKEVVPIFDPEGRRLTPIAFRAFEADIDGEKREIEFMIDSRIKTKNSMALKLLRRDSLDPNGCGESDIKTNDTDDKEAKIAEEILRDLNGVRMVFKNGEDIDRFEKHMIETLSAAGHEIKFHRKVSNLGKGSLSCRKKNVEIDGRYYELQIFTFEEFVNYLYKRGVSWPEYEIQRFFGSSSSEALFPDEFYPGLPDREEISQNAQETSYRVFTQNRGADRLWGQGGLRQSL